MQLLGHRVTGGEAEVRVLGQYLDGELHLVDDSLSGRLHLRPQFKVGEIVIRTITVFVMYGFELAQRALKMFRHYGAVLCNFATPAQMQYDVARLLHIAIRVDRAPRTTFPAAFFAAEFLLHIVAGMAAIFGSTKLSITSFATQFTLKCRSGFFGHIGQLLDSVRAVNENLAVRGSQVITYTGG
jgi:hypothetical protein